MRVVFTLSEEKRADQKKKKKKKKLSVKWNRHLDFFYKIEKHVNMYVSTLTEYPFHSFSFFLLPRLKRVYICAVNACITIFLWIFPVRGKSRLSNCSKCSNCKVNRTFCRKPHFFVELRGGWGARAIPLLPCSVAKKIFLFTTVITTLDCPVCN